MAADRTPNLFILRLPRMGPQGPICWLPALMGRPRDDMDCQCIGFRLAFQLGITAVLGCRVCNQGVRRIQQRPPCYRASDAINPTTQTAITAAVIQPTIFSQDDKVKRPITRGSLAKFIITTMIGAAITPLMTALQ